MVYDYLKIKISIPILIMQIGNFCYFLLQKFAGCRIARERAGYLQFAYLRVPCSSCGKARQPISLLKFLFRRPDR